VRERRARVTHPVWSTCFPNMPIRMAVINRKNSAGTEPSGPRFWWASSEAAINSPGIWSKSSTRRWPPFNHEPSKLRQPG